MKRLLFVFFCLFFYSFVLGQDKNAAVGKKEKEYLTYFSFENDLFVGSDDYYTSGVCIGLAGSVDSFEESIFPRFIGRLVDKIPGLNNKSRAHHLSLSLIHRIFTPQDISDPSIIVGDMPYSGQLVLNFSLSTQSLKHLDAYSLSIGVTGPMSDAAEVQTTIHYLNESPQPNGWDYQLEDEGLVNFFYEHRYRINEIKKTSRYFDSLAMGAVAIGNMISYAELGIGFRIGKNIPDDFYMSSSLFADRTIGLMHTSTNKKEFACYLYGFIFASAVYNSINLDGNTYVESNFVEYEPFGYRAVVGVAVEIKGFHFNGSIIYMSIPWDNPAHDHADPYAQLSFYNLF